MSWSAFVVARLRRVLLVLAALVVVSFVLIRLAPGDPARIIAGLRAGQESQDEARELFHLDRGYWSQFGHYVVDLVRGDLGTSFVTREPVTSVIADNVGPTIQLALISLVIIVVLGGGLGFLSAILSSRCGRWFETAFSAATGVMTAVPHYLLATFLVFTFALAFPVLPVAGEGGLAIVLPSIAISLGPAAVVARLLRVRTLEVLDEPYIRAARSKRLSTPAFLVRHVLPNSLTTVLPLAGILFAGLIGGAVVAEQVFARRGLGQALVNAVLARDYPVVQGITLFVGVVVVLLNALIEVLMAVVDPKVKEQL
ncbi:ABC transporter permease [Janibacter melonis]|uniref:ABC transporter permease n=1 Tax=Janibacter melonis TaxID=262209 RepID=UPI001782EE53